MTEKAKAPSARDGDALDIYPGSAARIDVSNISPARDRQAIVICRRVRVGSALAATIAGHAFGETCR